MTLPKDRRVVSSFLARSARESESSWRVHVRTSHVRTRVSFLALGVGIGGPRLISRSPVPPLPNHSGGSTTLADRMVRTLSRPVAPKSLGRATRSHRASPRAVLFRICETPLPRCRGRGRGSLTRHSPYWKSSIIFSPSDRLRRWFNNLVLVAVTLYFFVESNFGSLTPLVSKCAKN